MSQTAAEAIRRALASQREWDANSHESGVFASPRDGALQLGNAEFEQWLQQYIPEDNWAARLGVSPMRTDSFKYPVTHLGTYRDSNRENLDQRRMRRLERVTGNPQYLDQVQFRPEGESSGDTLRHEYQHRGLAELQRAGMSPDQRDEEQQVRFADKRQDVTPESKAYTAEWRKRKLRFGNYASAYEENNALAKQLYMQRNPIAELTEAREKHALAMDAMEAVESNRDHSSIANFIRDLLGRRP